AVFGPAVRCAGLPLVFWHHDAVGRLHWTDWLARLTPPDLVLSNSQYTRTTLLRLFPRAPGTVLFCPVAPPEGLDPMAARAEVRQALGTKPETVVVLQASRLERWKGHTLLIAALGQLKDQPGWEAWIAGGAQRPHELAYLAELRAAVTSTGLGGRV